MASQARINANRRNGQRSTGPKTEAGKARAKLNALKDGTHAKILSPVLPQEDPIELARINQWIDDLNPRNDAERGLVTSAANLSWELELPAGARRLAWPRAFARPSTRAPSGRSKKSASLCRLLLQCRIKILAHAGTTREDNPAAFLAGLEEKGRGLSLAAGSLEGVRSGSFYEALPSLPPFRSMVRTVGADRTGLQVLGQPFVFTEVGRAAIGGSSRLGWGSKISRFPSRGG